MSHDDFATEPVRGLPERPPAGEHILWQGRPHWWSLSCEALNLPWVAGYFAALAVWRFIAAIDLMPAGEALRLSVPFLILGALACAILTLIGWVMAQATVYTVTTRRVAMRVGAALQVTLNLPYSRIANVALDLRRGGTGTVAFEAQGRMPLGFLVLWPHSRPWHFSKPQAALRCIPEAQAIAHLIADAAEAQLARPEVARATPTATAEPGFAPAKPAVAAE